MTLSAPLPPLPPSPHDFTYNGGASEGVVGSYDLLCLPGMMVSVLADQTVTSSTGAGMAAMTLSVEDPRRKDRFGPASVGTADSSVLAIGSRGQDDESGGYANEFKFPYRDKATLNLASVVLVMGDYLAMVLQQAFHDLHSPPSTNFSESDEKYG